MNEARSQAGTGTAPVRIGLYTADDSDAAIALEARSAQGQSFQLRFDRPWFHRRAENFDDWRLVTARIDGDLVGVAGGALKPAVFQGRPTTALYLFDVRVAPEARRRSIAQQLILALEQWGRERGAEIGYGYAAQDNQASIQLTRQWIGATIGPAWAVFVYPVYRSGPPPSLAMRADARSVHAGFLEQEGPFDLYTDPAAAFASEACVASWRHERAGASAGCSAWSNEHIFAEVVERVPPALAAAGALLRRWPLSLMRAPHVPRSGERMKSWYIFDFHASDAAAADAVMAEVAAEARAQGIEHCYLIHRQGRSWVPALRRFPRLLAPIIPYAIISRYISGEPLLLRSPYVDIRDV